MDVDWSLGNASKQCCVSCPRKGRLVWSLPTTPSLTSVTSNHWLSPMTVQSCHARLDLPRLEKNRVRKEYNILAETTKLW